MKLTKAFEYMIISATLLASCSNGDATRVAWDVETDRLDIPEAGIYFELPEKAKDWVIAETSELPDEIIFAGVDTVSQTCVIFLQPELNVFINSTTDNLLNYITHQIIDQQNGVETDSINYKRGSIANRQYVEFNCNVIAGQVNQTSTVAFRGYLFEGANSDKCYGIVLTQPGERPDSISDSIANRIIKGINPLESQTKI